MPQIYNAFPTTIFVEKISDHEKYKKRFYELYPKYDYEENDISNTVSEGQVDPLIHLEPTLDPLFQEIVDNVKVYVHDVLRFKNIFNFVITKTWLSRMRDDKYIPFHIHSTSHISFVYYLNTPKDSHKLSFQNPHCTNSLFATSTSDKGRYEGNMVEEYNDLNSSTFFLHPQEGFILLFPSGLPHGTETVSQDFNGERLAIVGDLTLILKKEYLHYTNGYVDQKYWRKYE